MERVDLDGSQAQGGSRRTGLVVGAARPLRAVRLKCLSSEVDDDGRALIAGVGMTHPAAERFTANCPVGRWPSTAPLMRAFLARLFVHAESHT